MAVPATTAIGRSEIFDISTLIHLPYCLYHLRSDIQFAKLNDLFIFNFPEIDLWRVNSFASGFVLSATATDHNYPFVFADEFLD